MDTTPLKPCPFCGSPLFEKRRRFNPYACCRTQGCKGGQLPLLNLDMPEDVAAWNTRPESVTNERAAFMRDFKLYGRVYYDETTHQWLPTQDTAGGFTLASRVTGVWAGWCARAALKCSQEKDHGL